MQLSVAQWRPGGYVGGGRPCWGRTLIIGGSRYPLWIGVIEGYRFDVA